MVDVIHGALEGNEGTVDGQRVDTHENGSDQRKVDERTEQWDVLGGS
jgi:hypothetical protein